MKRYKTHTLQDGPSSVASREPFEVAKWEDVEKLQAQLDRALKLEELSDDCCPPPIQDREDNTCPFGTSVDCQTCRRRWILEGDQIFLSNSQKGVIKMDDSKIKNIFGYDSELANQFAEDLEKDLSSKFLDKTVTPEVVAGIQNTITDLFDKYYREADFHADPPTVTVERNLDDETAFTVKVEPPKRGD